MHRNDDAIGAISTWWSQNIILFYEKHSIFIELSTCSNWITFFRYRNKSSECWTFNLSLESVTKRRIIVSGLPWWVKLCQCLSELEKINNFWQMGDIISWFPPLMGSCTFPIFILTCLKSLLQFFKFTIFGLNNSLEIWTYLLDLDLTQQLKFI